MIREEVNLLVRDLALPGDVSESALFTGLLLEACPGTLSEDNATLLPDHLGDFQLNVDEYGALVESLSEAVAQRTTTTVTKLWALGKSKSEFAIAPLKAAYLSSVDDHNKGGEAYQALIGLDNLITDRSALANLARKAINSDDADLAALARQLL